jgi:hypothetical protein
LWPRAEINWAVGTTAHATTMARQQSNKQTEKTQPGTKRRVAATAVMAPRAAGGGRYSSCAASDGGECVRTPSAASGRGRSRTRGAGSAGRPASPRPRAAPPPSSCRRRRAPWPPPTTRPRRRRPRRGAPWRGTASTSSGRAPWPAAAECRTAERAEGDSTGLGLGRVVRLGTRFTRQAAALYIAAATVARQVPPCQ